MNESKWYAKGLVVLLAVLLSPLILLLALIAVPFILIGRSEAKKAYRSSPYYADFQKKYTVGINDDPAYRFYNGAATRKLPVAYLRGDADSFKAFVYGGALYLFPDFEQMGLSEDERAVWQVSFDGDWEDFEPAAQRLTESVDNPDGLPVHILVERRRIAVCDLTETPPPSCVFVTQSYETAFADGDPALHIRFPRTSADLYAMMRDTPDLCGEYELTEGGDGIRWRIREDVQITLGMDWGRGYIGAERFLFGKIESEITHWHPDASEMYGEVCEIGTRGHVLVLRERMGSGAVLYSGKKEDCPYKPDGKVLFGRYYYIEMK